MAETNGLLNRRTGKSGTEGSNPSVSANLWHCQRKRSIRIGKVQYCAHPSKDESPQVAIFTLSCVLVSKSLAS